MATNLIITRATTQLAETVSHMLWQGYAAASVGIVIAALRCKPLFGDFAGFGEYVMFWLEPDWISRFYGEGARDGWCPLKLGAWVVISAGSGLPLP